jgi:hypothetical protein
MDEDVRLQGSHEQQRSCARIPHAESACGFRTAEIVGDDLEALARRRVRIAGIERQHDRSLRAGKHVHREVLGKRALHEGNKLFSETAQDDPRIGRRVDLRKLQDERRHRDAPRGHRRRE